MIFLCIVLCIVCQHSHHMGLVLAFVVRILHDDCSIRLRANRLDRVLGDFAAMLCLSDFLSIALFIALLMHRLTISLQNF